MTKDFVLGVPFYRFYYDENKVDSILQSLKQLKYRRNDTIGFGMELRKMV